jgi:50S ribosomal protein L16 3-hydroxylase
MHTLSEILAPVSSRDFFSLHWPHSPLFIAGDSLKFASLLKAAGVQDLAGLMASRKSRVRACLPDFEDEYSSIMLDPQDAQKAYRNNMTLVFEKMHEQSAVLKDVLENIRSELGLLTGGAENDLCKARSIMYATPAGAGTRLHFDANANFVIQVSGAKRWWLAKNNSVNNPTERFTAGAGEMSAALERQCHAVLLSELPPDATEIVMEPGCVLFVPRGYWHATATEEDSLSLNFTFGQPTWADVMTKSLQEWLLNSEEWRALADGLESRDETRRENAIAQFELLVKKLSSELPEIAGRQLLEESGLI